LEAEISVLKRKCKRGFRYCLSTFGNNESDFGKRWREFGKSRSTLRKDERNFGYYRRGLGN
jgi:hypothetical protein